MEGVPGRGVERREKVTKKKRPAKEERSRIDKERKRACQAEEVLRPGSRFVGQSKGGFDVPYKKFTSKDSQ